jgi:NADH:ubiquinone oxidoreductase subunit H
VTLFFGGWTLPAVPSSSHLANVLLAAAAFAVKVGVVSFVACRIAGRAKRSPSGRVPSSWPVGGGTEFVWLFALALANLGATIALSVA